MAVSGTFEVHLTLWARTQRQLDSPVLKLVRQNVAVPRVLDLINVYGWRASTS